jgi:hypothetical protein
MTRPYTERRNRKIIVLIERRCIHPKDIPDLLEKVGYFVTYENVRQIIHRHRKCHNLSQAISEKTT